MGVLHRDSNGNMPTFASRFILGRMAGFEKDMTICLTGVPSKTRSGFTHAYFPALMSCCSTLEYLAGLYAGRADTSISRRDIAGYAVRYMPQPDYDGETVRILVDAFRNAVAHRGIATGVWLDGHAAHVGRRITWKIDEGDSKPSLALRAEAGVIKRDSPWRCAYTHRMHIHLSRLCEDIRDSSTAYLRELKTSKSLLSNFERCMRQLYP